MHKKGNSKTSPSRETKSSILYFLDVMRKYYSQCNRLDNCHKAFLVFTAFLKLHMVISQRKSMETIWGIRSDNRGLAYGHKGSMSPC